MRSKEHKKKHSDFSERFVRMCAPVDLGEIKWTQDWLAQHIKNTDHQYKQRLNGADSGDNFTGAL